MIDPNLTAQVKDRVGLKEFLEGYGLRFRKGGGTWKANCPFHEEKTASFTVWLDNKNYFCFGCHKSGDALTFLMEKEGLDFRNALERLAAKAGIALPDPDPQAAALKAKREHLMEIYALATEYFVLSLQHPRADVVRKYLTDERHLSTDTIKKYGLGYAPYDHDNSRFRDFMLARGVKMPELAEASLWRGDHPFFRQRVIIPIRDRGGQVIAFSGRVVGQGGSVPKYLNSPTTPIFDKGSTLYGLSEAKEAIRMAGKAVIVEGQFDVIATHQADRPLTVAVMGTALTSRHLELLNRFTTEVILCYDGDAAGQRAINHAIELVNLGQSQRVNFKVVELPEGKDPAEVIYDNRYRWVNLIDEAVPVIDYYLAKVEKDFDLASAAGKKNAVEEMLPLIKSVADPVEREHYLNRLSELTATSLSSIVEKAGIAPKAMLARGLNKAASQQPTLYMRELALLRALIEYFPRSLEVASSDGQAASASDFFDDTNRMVFQSLKSAFMEWRGLDEIGDELDEGVFRIYQSLRAAIAASQVEIETDPAQADTAIKFELDKLRKMNFRKVYLELVDEIKKLQADDPLVVELAESALQINQLQKLYP